MQKRFYLSIALSAILSTSLWAQPDTSNAADDFDFSDFELAAPAAKSFCTNKVLGQSPTSLIGLFYDYQAPHNLTAGNLVTSPNGNLEESSEVNAAHGVSLVGNFPLISRNNILINLNVVYQDQRYNIAGDPQHPLTRTLNENGLRRSAAIFTIFKPLNDKRFLLGQLGAEMNGDYSFNTSQPFSTVRLPAALLYGFKPSDRLMYAFGLSRTYLGGSLNYVPVIYYYHTFLNQKWGVEALLPARGLVRYRFNSTSLLSAGYTVQGATYRLNNFGKNAMEFAQANPNVSPNLLAAEDVELRRSEIRAGLNYTRALSGFIWLSVEAGYRINYSFDADQGGDFTRLFGNDDPYFIENELENPLYFAIGLSYVSP
jgi:hypothetical protein